MELMTNSLKTMVVKTLECVTLKAVLSTNLVFCDLSIPWSLKLFYLVFFNVDRGRFIALKSRPVLSKSNNV